MLQIQNLVYAHPNKDLLFEDISLSIGSGDKIALIGNNGSGKSSLLSLMAGRLKPLSGTIKCNTAPWYVPQHFGQYNSLRVDEALQVHDKLAALHAVLEGTLDEAWYNQLADDWSIEERCARALHTWGLEGIDLSQPFGNLSGGQKTRLFLAGIHLHQPSLVLLDEPTNHLDTTGRALLYEYIANTNASMVVVSHDRSLLNMLPAMYELSKRGLTVYGGNYAFYTVQKANEAAALEQELRARETSLRKAKDVAREATERQQKLDARGRKKQEKAGVATIMLNTLRNKAENSTARMKYVHAEKLGALALELQALRQELPDSEKMRLGFSDSALHKGKRLLAATELNYAWDDKPLWKAPLSFEIYSGDRIALKGANGSGKSTLVRLILGQLEPTEGSMYRADLNALYIDQDYSPVATGCTVHQQAQQYNTQELEPHELNSRLTHFLFAKDDWDKPTNVLSGGEKMRLLLCCLSLSDNTPDLIVLDEPTNNLDLQNITILCNAINDYSGTLIAVSHDQVFLEELGVAQTINL